MQTSTKDATPSTPLSRRGLLTQITTLTLAVLGGSHAARARQTAKAQATTPWDATMEIVVNLTISPSDGGRYRNPYVVVWLEDKSSKELRTISLWVGTRHNTRWISNLRRWYRDAHDYWAAGGPDLIVSQSSATRMPGAYSLTWDGKDDKGKPVAQGTYTLNLESAREHGPYGLVQKEITIGSRPFKTKLDGNGDIQEASIEYRKRA